MITRGAGQCKGRKICRASHADLGIGFGDATFSGGDVRAALEQIRWHTEGNGHRPCLELCRCHREARRGFANKERDRVFELRALNGQVSGLRLSRVQLSLGLRDVLVGCDARIVADLSELERFLIRNNRFIEESLLLVKRADLKIIDGQFGVDSQGTFSRSPRVA